MSEVLLLEDEQALRELGKHTLENKIGIEVDTKEGIEEVGDWDYSLAVTDHSGI